MVKGPVFFPYELPTKYCYFLLMFWFFVIFSNFVKILLFFANDFCQKSQKWAKKKHGLPIRVFDFVIFLVQIYEDFLWKCFFCKKITQKNVKNQFFIKNRWFPKQKTIPENYERKSNKKSSKIHDFCRIIMILIQLNFTKSTKYFDNKRAIFCCFQFFICTSWCYNFLLKIVTNL